MIPRVSTRLFAASCSLLASAGCLLGDVTAIPCGADAECPTETFCDLPGGVCITTAAEGAPPNVTLLGVEDEDGTPRTFTSVPSGQEASVVLHVKNDGGYVAEAIELELSDLSCAPMSLPMGAVPERLDPDETAKVTLTFSIARDCANPVPVDWFTRFSGREHRGVFELFHESSPGQGLD
jgi:hypothetical protein